MDYPESKTVPWSHQVEAWNLIKKHPASYLMHDMGCISGDAIININRASNGKKIKLKDLFNLFHGINRTKRFDPTIPIYAKALCDGVLKQHRIVNVLDKGIRETISISTKSGKHLVLTPDHKVAMADGSWKEPEIGDTVLINGQCVDCGQEKKRIYSTGFCDSCQRRGKRNPNCRTGKCIDNDGYIRIGGMFDHPRRNPANQVYEHILVMEEFLGRYIDVSEVIHHKDHNRANNSISNLEITTNKKHPVIHNLFINMDGGVTGTGGRIRFIPKEDTIVSIKPAGPTNVYDIVMDDPHRNFVANGIIVHNCGKSKTVIDASTGLNSKKILIICPKKVISVWPKQFALHSARNVEVIPLIKGDSKDKALLMETRLRNCNGQPQAFVINYESSIRPPLGPEFYPKSRNIRRPGSLLKHRWDLLVADEAHRIKSPGGRTSWQLYRLGKLNKRKIFLSGTPLPNSPLDIYAQYRALDPTIFPRNYTLFRARYAVMGGYLGKQIFEYQNIEDLNERMFKIAHEVRADDVLELPPKVDREIDFDLEPSTMKIYRGVRDDLIAEWDQGQITADNILVKLLRLAEISCGIATTDTGRKVIIDKSRAERVVDFLQDLPLREPVVIYCKFTPELQLLKKLVKKSGRSVSEVSGNKDQLEEWQNGDTNTIILQIDAGSEGIDLTRARYAIYSSIGLKLGVYRQSRRRIRRPGQNQKVFYYHVLGNRTIDIANTKAMYEKRTIVDFFLRGLHEFKKTGIAPKTKKIRGLALAQLMGNV